MTQTEQGPRPAAGLEAAQRWLPALLMLFVGSGCAALIYEVVWFQLLQLSVGSSAVSLGILLGVFMGGMCLGSLLLPRYIDAKLHPLKVYAYLEIGIGVCGLVVLFLVPVLGLDDVEATQTQMLNVQEPELELVLDDEDQRPFAVSSGLELFRARHGQSLSHGVQTGSEFPAVR